jgi:hypothetical protein
MFYWISKVRFCAVGVSSEAILYGYNQPYPSRIALRVFHFSLYPCIHFAASPGKVDSPWNTNFYCCWDHKFSPFVLNDDLKSLRSSGGQGVYPKPGAQGRRLRLQYS